MEKVITKDDLLKILDKNNTEVFKLLNKRDEMNPDSQSYKDIMVEINFANGESMMLLKLIKYIVGEL